MRLTAAPLRPGDAPGTTQQLPPRPALTRAACLALLAPGGHGRVATTMQAVPVIIPVTFTLLGEDIVIDPGSGEGLPRAIANCVVAFQTDHVGADGGVLWQVHVTGVAGRLSQAMKVPGYRLSSEIITGWLAGS